jgi:hypothetical protein
MGFISTEQTTAIIDSVASAIDAGTPDTVTTPVEPTNYVAWAIVGLVPVVATGIFAWIRKKEKRTKW